MMQEENPKRLNHKLLGIRSIKSIQCVNCDYFQDEPNLRSLLALAEALIETIENVYPDICDMAQYRAWKEAGR